MTYQSEYQGTSRVATNSPFGYLSNELHNNIGQLLVKMECELEKERMHHPSLRSSLQPVAESLQMTIYQLALLTRSLGEQSVNSQSLLYLVRNEVNRLGSTAMHNVAFQTDGFEPTLSKEVELVVFRAFQEILCNAIKHSGATGIKIVLEGKNGLHLQVSDNGNGFDVEAALSTSKGLGLKNILRRMSVAGLECSIESKPNEGCVVKISS